MLSQTMLKLFSKKIQKLAQGNSEVNQQDANSVNQVQKRKKEKSDDQIPAEMIFSKSRSNLADNFEKEINNSGSQGCQSSSLEANAQEQFFQENKQREEENNYEFQIQSSSDEEAPPRKLSMREFGLSKNKDDQKLSGKNECEQSQNAITESLKKTLRERLNGLEEDEEDDSDEDHKVSMNEEYQNEDQNFELNHEIKLTNERAESEQFLLDKIRERIRKQIENKQAYVQKQKPIGTQPNFENQSFVKNKQKNENQTHHNKLLIPEKKGRPRKQKELSDPLQSNALNYDDNFKRKFVKKTLKAISELSRKESSLDLVRSLAKKINIHAYELKSWIAAFKIIFSVEAEMNQNTLSNKQIINEIEKGILNYLNYNKYQKKYKIIKIVTIVFRQFGVSESRIGSWLNQFVMERRRQLKGIDLSQYKIHSKASEWKGALRISKKRGQQEVSERENKDSQINDDNSVGRKIIESVDQEINHYINQKADSVKVNPSTLRAMHKQFSQPRERGSGIEASKLNQNYFLKKNPEKINLQPLKAEENRIVPKKQQNQTRKIDAQAELSKLQHLLLMYLNKNPMCQCRNLEKESERVMADLRFPKQLKIEVRSRWFAFFIKKNKLTINKETRIIQKIQKHASESPQQSQKVMMKVSNDPKSKNLFLSAKETKGNEAIKRLREKISQKLKAKKENERL